MAIISSAPTSLGNWRPAAVAGAVVFGACFAVFTGLSPLDSPARTAAVAATVALLAMALTSATVLKRTRVHFWRMHAALNNMSQGLCMFDRNERLVICNKRYVEIY